GRNGALQPCSPTAGSAPRTTGVRAWGSSATLLATTRSSPSSPSRLLRGCPRGRLVRQLGLDLLDRRQATCQIPGARVDEPRFPVRDPHGPSRSTERVLDDELILPAAEQKTDCWLIVRLLERVVDSRKVHVKLPGHARIELHRLQLDDHEAAQLE